MNISIVGTGYVGLVTGAIFSDFGFNVNCIDIDQKKIALLNQGKIPFYEPGLEEIVKRNLDKKRLNFTTDYKSSIPQANVIFICVGTPQDDSGKADLSYLYTSIEQLSQHLDNYTLIVIKSTVPLGLETKIEQIIKKKSKAEFELASCPEFLKEGSAISDTLNPDRIVIGTSSKKASDLLLEIYKHIEGQRLICDFRSAQLIKYASNAFLASKISYANALALICEKVGADVEHVIHGMSLDQRIGRQFLYPGVGYGGSCFPKDLAAFVHFSNEYGYDFEFLKSVEKINNDQIDLYIKKLQTLLPNLEGKTITLLGLSFKPNTDDLREAPSIKIINKLLPLKVNIKTYDPIAIDNAKKILKDYPIEYAKDAYCALKKSDALLLITEWNEFKELDLEKIKKIMKTPIILDGRNIYDPQKVKELGFKYQGIGRN